MCCAAEHVACGTLCCSYFAWESEGLQVITFLLKKNPKNIGEFEAVGQRCDGQNCQGSMALENSEGIGLRKFLLQSSLSFCSCSLLAAFPSIPAVLNPRSSSSVAASLVQVRLGLRGRCPGVTGCVRECCPWWESKCGVCVFFSCLLIPLYATKSF